jgi:AhpD family alkylhydroperoxidase
MTASTTTTEGTAHRRLDYPAHLPTAYQTLVRLHRLVNDSALEQAIVELVRVRASQMNGCAYCIDMHTKDARAAGETEQRLYALSAWRETPFFSPQERAALALCEAGTALVGSADGGDAAMAEARTEFSEEELSALLFAIAEINAWNRLGVLGRPEVGRYQPAGH